MPVGGGKYDAVCAVARNMAEAETAIVIIVNGNLGSGFSMQSVLASHAIDLPNILEHMARQIREAQT